MPQQTMYRLLESELWASAFAVRSKESTPLYISRYNGPRRSRALRPHPFWELTAVVSGRGEMQGQTDLPLQPGVLLLIPPGWKHREHAPADMDTIWIGCRGTRFEALPDRLIHVRDMSMVAECERLWLFAQQTTEKIGPELDAGLTALVSTLLRARRATDKTPQGDVVDGIIRYMHTHLATPMRLEDLARRAGCSEGHFSRIFRRRTGHSVVAFLTELRIKQAAHLLDETGLTVSEIAERVGFTSLFYFSRVFRRLVGTAPSVYRHQIAHSGMHNTLL